ESMGRPHAPKTPIERDIVEAETTLRDFAEKNPLVDCTVLRFANVLGPGVRTSHIGLFSGPAVPMILGFDPRYQFVHEDDVVHALEHVVQRELPGVFNVAADGVLALSEVAGLLSKPYAPIIPPWGTGLAAAGLRRVGLNISPEMLNQLRFGRGVDNRRLKAAGFRYGHTSRETVLVLGEHLRLHPLLRSGGREPYRYEREVEEFLRWSPHVRGSQTRNTPALTSTQVTALQRLLEARARSGAGKQEGGPGAEDLPSDPDPDPAVAEPVPAEQEPEATPPVDHYDDLAPEEVISLLGSLEPEDLLALRDYERIHGARASIVGAIESALARGTQPHLG
ncbi:MAG: hypothetical protein M3350_08495, partial [Actinomycetota bacterium]|nr:hypothetical protein [Actinomycetota bacterium]